ncbi:MAG: hypothetical protein CMF34_01775 [Leeuwenhoekiella sp.]|nr:hypothetical protein [Leeuwenhoekiella sp.]MBH13554.1 hypothetical protein [Leeuwenhoekiella sp.]HAX15702.1 hypothetical protein [Leeuwenhoekiella sp.]|tara:strand:- start:11171 stop:12034 length:864 start_codon:yes stop_codon:yes gene_type:complete
MNKLEIQGSGFPGTNKTWRFVRDMINDVHKLTALGGQNYIVTGCTVNGGQVSAGYVVINGELLPFEAGALAADVIIVETVENTTYLEDLDQDGQGDEKQTYFTRVARFGSGAGSVAWNTLERINPIAQLQKAIVPVGGIMMWSGAVNTIPSGWSLCDGSNGTPDLSGKFIVGYDANDEDYDTIGNAGGEKEVTLTEAQLAQHNHSGSVTIPAHSHSLQGKTAITHDGEGGDGNRLTNTDNIGSSSITQTSLGGGGTVSITTNNKGGNQAHENRPPYFTLAYIMYVGN